MNPDTLNETQAREDIRRALDAAPTGSRYRYNGKATGLPFSATKNEDGDWSVDRTSGTGSSKYLAIITSLAHNTSLTTSDGQVLPTSPPPAAPPTPTREVLDAQRPGTVLEFIGASSRDPRTATKRPDGDWEILPNRNRPGALGVWNTRRAETLETWVSKDHPWTLTPPGAEAEQDGREQQVRAGDTVRIGPNPHFTMDGERFACTTIHEGTVRVVERIDSDGDLLLAGGGIVRPEHVTVVATSPTHDTTLAPDWAQGVTERPEMSDHAIRAAIAKAASGSAMNRPVTIAVDGEDHRIISIYLDSDQTVVIATEPVPRALTYREIVNGPGTIAYDSEPVVVIDGVEHRITTATRVDGRLIMGVER